MNSGKTAGQLAYEAGGGAIHSYERIQRRAWDDLPPAVREGYEVAAAAVETRQLREAFAAGMQAARMLAAQEPHAAPDSNHEPGLSECGCRDCDPRRHGTAPAPDPRVVPLDAAVVHKELHRLIKGIETLAADLTASEMTRPSRKSQIEDEIAIALRKLLEDE